jgi:hypothetical protein
MQLGRDHMQWWVLVNLEIWVSVSVTDRQIVLLNESSIKILTSVTEKCETQQLVESVNLLAQPHSSNSYRLKDSL